VVGGWWAECFSFNYEEMSVAFMLLPCYYTGWFT